MMLSKKSHWKLLFLGIGALLLSSCNRGIGCPSDFSLNVEIVEVFSSFINLISF